MKIKKYATLIIFALAALIKVSVTMADTTLTIPITMKIPPLIQVKPLIEVKNDNHNTPVDIILLDAKKKSNQILLNIIENSGQDFKVKLHNHNNSGKSRYFIATTDEGDQLHYKADLVQNSDNFTIVRQGSNYAFQQTRGAKEKNGFHIILKITLTPSGPTPRSGAYTDNLYVYAAVK